jgi:hypothetical protein
MFDLRRGNKGSGDFRLYQTEDGRTRSWQDLVALIDKPRCAELVSAAGTKYQVEVLVFWDGPEDGALRVSGSIDDGGWRSVVPLTRCFIVSSDGTCVDE